jgi:uncharacterized protein YjbI with pentapeptide repeats
MPKTAHITPPQLSSELTTISLADFIAEASLEAGSLQDADLSGVNAPAISLDEVILERVSLAGARLEKLAANDLIAKNCDLSAARCSEISLLRSRLAAGRMTGLDCSRGLLKDVLFTNCKLNLVNFRFTKLTRVRFVDCVLTEADFMGAELTHVVFEGCVLERTIFARGSMKDVDLRGSQLVDIAGWQGLRGATIDGEQLAAAAPYLALELGIKVVN